MATWTPTYVNQLIVGWSLCCSAWLMPASSSLTPTGIPQARFGQGRRGLHNWRWPRHLPADPRAYAQARSLFHAHPFSLLSSIAHDFGWCTPCAEVVTTSRSIPPSFACTVRPTTTRSCTVPSRTSSSCQSPTTVTCASWYGTPFALPHATAFVVHLRYSTFSFTPTPTPTDQLGPADQAGRHAIPAPRAAVR